MTDSNAFYNAGLELMQSVESQLRRGELDDDDRTVAAKAESHLVRAIEAAPNHGRAHIMLGMLYNFTARYTEAIPHLVIGMQLPKESDDWLTAADTLVNVWFNLNAPAAAYAPLREIVQHHPHAVSGHFKLGLVCALLGMRDQAVSHYQQALARDPDHAGAREQLTQLGVAST